MIQPIVRKCPLCGETKPIFEFDYHAMTGSRGLICMHCMERKYYDKRTQTDKSSKSKKKS